MARRTARLAGLPQGATFRHVVGLALSRHGFTVSLFITGLAFDDPMVVDRRTGDPGSVGDRRNPRSVLFWAAGHRCRSVRPRRAPHPEPAETH